MTIPSGTWHEIVERHVGDLYVDPTVQRALKKNRVDKIAGDFHPEALGVLTTSLRPDGLIHLIDGQHRYRAAETVGYQGVIKTNEYRGLSLSQEAALFRLLNNTEKVSPIDQFVVACVEGRTDAIRISKFLADNGWTVGTSAGNGKISAVKSLQRVYALGEHGPWAASATIAVVTSAWGHVAAAVNGNLIEGIGRFLIKYHDDEVDLTDLGKRLSASPGGPDALLGFARGQKLSRTGNLSTQVARVVLSIYNERRRTTKLPDWQ